MKTLAMLILLVSACTSEEAKPLPLCSTLGAPAALPCARDGVCIFDTQSCLAADLPTCESLGATPTSDLTCDEHNVCMLDKHYCIPEGEIAQ